MLPSEGKFLHNFTESVEYKLKRNKISDPGWGINEIFEKIKEEDDSSSSSTYDQIGIKHSQLFIENEIKEIKARKYFLVPKRFERDPSEDPLQASRYVKLLNMVSCLSIWIF